MSKDIKDIKRLLAKPTFVQIVATQPPTNFSGTPNNQRKLNTVNDRTKKQQCKKFAITITAATAPDTTKNQLKCCGICIFVGLRVRFLFQQSQAS